MKRSMTLWNVHSFKETAAANEISYALFLEQMTIKLSNLSETKVVRSAFYMRDNTASLVTKPINVVLKRSDLKKLSTTNSDSHYSKLGHHRERTVATKLWEMRVHGKLKIKLTSLTSPGLVMMKCADPTK